MNRPTPTDWFRDRVAALADAGPGWDRDTPVRTVIGSLGRAGLLRERWAGPDHRLGVALVGELARRGLFSQAVGVGLHVEAVVALLRAYGGTGGADLLDGALDGRLVGCIAASEQAGGSDLGAVTTVAEPVDGGWRVRGAKHFVTLVTVADLAIVLARITGDRPERLGAFLLDAGDLHVERTHHLAGATGLDTSAVTFDAVVAPDRLLGPPGAGLAVLSHGLTRERLAVAALVCGTCRLALSLAVTRAHRRTQFGVPLIAHQALRLRLADLQAELIGLEAHVEHLANQARPSPREVAGLKVRAARYGESCARECQHVFGGEGYLADATPLPALVRDLALARIGGGTDEVMWELVAGGLRPDETTYRRWCPTAADVDPPRAPALRARRP